MGSRAVVPRFSIRVRRTLLAVVAVLAAFVPGGSSASAATSPPTVVLSFDDIDASHGPMDVTGLYEGVGVKIEHASAVADPKFPDIPRSGKNVAMPCYAFHTCAPMVLHFSQPQAAVTAWVGVAIPMVGTEDVTLSLYDEAGARVGHRKVTLGPDRTAARVEISASSPTGNISKAEIGWDASTAADPAARSRWETFLAVDDVTLAAPLVSLSAGRTHVDFGSVLSGSPTLHRGLDVTNNGNVEVSLGQPSVSRDSRFTVSGCADGPLEPGQRCTLDVSFSATGSGQAKAIVSFPTSGTGIRIAVSARVTVPATPPTSPRKTTQGTQSPTQTPTVSATTPSPTTSPTTAPPNTHLSGLVPTLVSFSPFIAFVMVVGALAYLFGTRATRRVSDRRTPPAPPPTHLVTTDARTTQRIRSEPPPVVVLTYDRADATPDWRQ